MDAVAARRLTTLAEHYRALQSTRIVDLFASDPDRPHRMSRTFGDLYVDFSKQKVTAQTLTLLLQLADAAGVAEARAAMFTGRRINVSENRAVLHVALRNRSPHPIMFDGRDVMLDVRRELQRMLAFAEMIRDQRQSPIRHIVNIGIGGSDLGPACAAQALKPFAARHLSADFVSNVDGAHLADTLERLDPAATLFVIVSKTFTTVETMMNAQAARAWIAATMGEDRVKDHFCAVSTNLDAVHAFGITPERIFGFWDWVGGRYSLWSAVGLSVALLIGQENFCAMLEGAHAMDEHFREAPPEDNIPLLLGLLGVYHRNLCGYASRAVIPYDQRLARLPAFLQQLDMESNGKSVDSHGQALTISSGPVVWGEPGTNGQHAFFQWLHQGSDVVPVEFLVAAKPIAANREQHDVLLANCLAQSQALLQGRSLAEVQTLLLAQGLDQHAIRALAPHRVFSGDRPSTTLLYRALDPKTLGLLLALYEHRVFVEGAVWGINSFDQWGVELGKERAASLLPAVQGASAPANADPSTRALLAQLAVLRG